MSVRRSLIILTIVTLSLPVGISLMSARQEAAATEQAAEEAAALQTYEVERGTVLVTVPSVGAINAQQIANLSFLSSGQVIDILVAEGDSVVEGMPLVQLENRAQIITFERANLDYETAVRQYEDLLVVDEDEIAVAEANLASAQAAYSSTANAVSSADINAAELRYQQAQAALEGAQQARNNASGSLTDQTIQLLDARVGEASFNAETARLRLADLQSSNNGELGTAGARIVQAQAQLDAARLGASEFELQQAQIAIDRAAAVLDQAQSGYDRTILAAPFSGVISNLDVEIGQRISAGATVLQLVNVSPLRLVGELDEMDLTRVDEGQLALVELDALPNVLLDATVSRVASSGTAENGLVTYEINLQLNTSDDRIRPGMTAEASIVVQQVEDALIVPNRFVQFDRAQNASMVNLLLPDGSLQPQEVTVGVRGDEYTEILSGIRAGEIVAVQPLQRNNSLSLFGG